MGVREHETLGIRYTRQKLLAQEPRGQRRQVDQPPARLRLELHEPAFVDAVLDVNVSGLEVDVAVPQPEALALAQASLRCEADEVPIWPRHRVGECLHLFPLEEEALAPFKRWWPDREDPLVDNVPPSPCVPEHGLQQLKRHLRLSGRSLGHGIDVIFDLLRMELAELARHEREKVWEDLGAVGKRLRADALPIASEPTASFDHYFAAACSGTHEARQGLRRRRVERPERLATLELGQNVLRVAFALVRPGMSVLPPVGTLPANAVPLATLRAPHAVRLDPEPHAHRYCSNSLGCSWCPRVARGAREGPAGLDGA
jgi:hypothetical protein